MIAIHHETENTSQTQKGPFCELSHLIIGPNLTDTPPIEEDFLRGGEKMVRGTGLEPVTPTVSR